MTSDDLERSRDLRKVAVKALPARAKELGDAESIERHTTAMGGCTCFDNALCLTDAMKKAGEDWQIVFGFAYGSDSSYPVAHVWVRRGDEHFDPTWSCYDEWLEHCRYYALAGEQAVNITSLSALEGLGQRWKVVAPPSVLEEVNFPPLNLTPDEEMKMIQELAGEIPNSADEEKA